MKTAGYTHQLKITDEETYQDTEDKLEKCTNILNQKGTRKDTERREPVRGTRSALEKSEFGTGQNIKRK
jgi:hypothetical protein